MNNGVNNSNNVQNQLTGNVPIGDLLNKNATANIKTVQTQPQPPQQPANSTPTITQTQPIQIQKEQPVVQQPASTQPNTTQQPTEQPKEEKKDNKKEKKKKVKEDKEEQTEKKSPIIYFIIIIIFLIAYIAYNNISHTTEIKNLNFNCTPVSTTKEEKELDLNSTIVQDLYNKVQTNIKEDLALTELNDSMKLYLAYRQIVPSKIYESNCNLFRNTDMYSYTCIDNKNETPNAFKEETLQIELKKLFGEKTNIENNDIQLGRSCIGGYNYIKERKEYVEGTCTNYTATSFKATKKLTKAISRKSTIILKEEVKYYGNEGLTVPKNLKSGTYVYTFKLDTNYNYVYVSKEYEEKY